MTRRAYGAGVLAEALLLGLVTAMAAAADPPAAPLPRSHRRIQLFQAREVGGASRLTGAAIAPLPQRFTLEMAGARSNAQDWLHDAGFSLLEDRDSEGQRSYTLQSGTLASTAPLVHLQARVGRPELAAGLRLNHNSASVGLTMPLPHSVIEIEGVDNRGAGYGFLGSLRWHDARDRLQYGVALPVAIGKGAAVGVLFQLRCTLD